MIEGVILKELKVIPDERGYVQEILRCDDTFFDKFGQVYLSVANLNVVKGWHYHKKQTDRFTCIKGMMKVVLYDSREESPSFGDVDEIFVGDLNHKLIVVPPFVYHGFKAIGEGPAYFLSVPNLPYDYKNPDEYRLPPDTEEIPYDWGLIKGLKHG